LDLREAGAKALGGSPVNDDVSAWFRALELLEAMDKLTIASIHGPCLGSGLEIALACDFRVADETAVFSMPQVLYGSLADGSPAYRLPQLVGLAKAKEIVLLGERFDARAAKALGLLWALAPRGELERETARLVRRCLDLGFTAAVLVKRLLQSVSLPDGRPLAKEIGRIRRETAQAGDFAEAMQAYLARHRPKV
jgi:enoyl-CoA hydratase/carnithine racemase